MPYNRKYTSTRTGTASCRVGTGPTVIASATSQSIISQRDADRKAESWAKAKARAVVRCT
jgi:hypothetical protein